MTNVAHDDQPVAKFNPLETPLALLNPRRLSIQSAWIEHIPFAFTLMQLLQPRLVVELGVHMGDSYCAFCQAIEAIPLSCKCIGIDTWTGDEHAGTYSEAILNDLRAHHDPLYSRFSTLLRSTFDDALASVADGSVDLLHIDGLHTYEAVRHDFESWTPKLSHRAVVLFHDTVERQPGFGVFQLWAELAARFPNFEFTHGHGLGVVGVGGALPAPVLDFLSAANAYPQLVRPFFATLGHRLSAVRTTFQLQQALNGRPAGPNFLRP